MINRLLQKIDALNQRSLLIYTISASMLLAAWMQHIQHGWINPDTTLYFEQGRLFALGQWKAMLDVFNWPLFGICIGFVHQITSLSIHQSAQLLSMLFFGLATASFLFIIKLAGGNNRTLFLGALLLFSSQYIVGDALEMLMRDQGFWAFYLSSIAFFIRYCQKHRKLDALLWQVCIIIATLFRIEAILYLLLLPLIYFTLFFSDRIKQRLIKLLNTYSLSILAGLIISAMLISQPELSMSQFGRLDEVFTSDLLNKLTEKLTTQADVMANEVLGRYLDEFAVQGLLLTFIYVIFVKVISTTGLMTTVLSALSIRNSTLRPIPHQVLFVVLGIALLASLLIITKVFVLSGRYVIALSWILLTFASFYLSALSYRLEKKWIIIFSIISLILCLGLVKNILPKRDGYNYQQDAIAWLRKNQQKEGPIFFSEPRMHYYAGTSFLRESNTWGKFSNEVNVSSKLPYEYLVISISKRDQHKVHFIKQKLKNYQEVKRFYAPKNKKYCAIYQKQNTVQ